MEGTYPILDRGERIGRLRVTRQGLLTVFSARAREREGLLRLSVYGDGREGYLGVMAPAGGGELALRRALSRAALARFPARFAYAGPAGQADTGGQNPPQNDARTAPAAPGDGPGGGREGAAEGARSGFSDEDALWYAAPDGTLTHFDGRRLLVALPAGDPRLPPGAERVLRVIDGRKYVVFPW